MTDRPLRVMWLLNHTTLRKFEIPQMESLGIVEIFLPKSFPYDEGNLSANVDYSKDATLNLAPHELQILNQQNWYKSPSQEAWEIANRHFDVMFVGFFPDQLRSAIRNFKGVIVLHAFGLAGSETYSNLLRRYLTIGEFETLKKISHRFLFGAGYDHLADTEDDFIKSRNCFLPVGLSIQNKSSEWRGTDKRIFFVCPRVNSTQYFHEIYRDFIQNFSQFSYVIGGAQPVPVKDKRVLGFVDRATHDRNMRELAVMFYHSQEPNHIHYHPFEAVQSGMPLIFMSGGVLDRFGGTKLPGRCTSISEAREKIRRVLEGDDRFIESVRRSQLVLLEPMRPENCASHWRDGFDKIGRAHDLSQAKRYAQPRRRKRLAIFIPIAYRGGTLRGAKMLAEAIEIGSRQAGEDIEVVLAHLDNPDIYRDEDFFDLPKSIRRRSFWWKTLPLSEATRVAIYGGLAQNVTAPVYQVPDDKIQQFMDCDLWIFVSDRLVHPLLPLRPYALVVFDYLQRYENFLPRDMNESFLCSARHAERVIVTTEFTRRDAIQYAGLREERVSRLPILAPRFDHVDVSVSARPKRRFFIWTTNVALHKNHENAFRALARYYDALGGELQCIVTGADTERLLSPDIPYLRSSAEIVRRSPGLKRNMKILGELSDQLYRVRLAQSEFLWHAARMDNGTFSVVEAAHLGVPSLSSDYPAMREFNDAFSLNLRWMDPADPNNMAESLMQMEADAAVLRQSLPSADRLAQHSLERLARSYWDVVKECL
ncbi:glycosyltransferase involved in cell wall biosynthesis [Bradyrhizobium japonicum]